MGFATKTPKRFYETEIGPKRWGLRLIGWVKSFSATVDNVGKSDEPSEITPMGTKLRLPKDAWSMF